MLVDGKIFPYKKTIERLYEKAGEVLGEDFSRVNISLNFVSGEEIKSLNNQFRQIDRQTDVLSFPNLNKTTDQKLTEFDSERNFDDGLLFLGDVVICKKVAYAQAKEYGHSKKREICFLALHGLLHLLGYDHIEKQDEEEMQGVADKILKEFGVNR
ncbi:MAG: rRNA maturation RNase YbeY [Clostridia bacterium]|nr:rRNA maturation RNase YbeY [Clostridia bacterium]